MLNFLFFFLWDDEMCFPTEIRGFIYVSVLGFFVFCLCFMFSSLTVVLTVMLLIRPKKFKSKWKTAIISRKFKSQNMIVFCLVSLHDQWWFFSLLLRFIVLPRFFIFIFFIISDLDDTLYPYSSGVCEQIAKNIEGTEFTEFHYLNAKRIIQYRTIISLILFCIFIFFMFLLVSRICLEIKG